MMTARHALVVSSLVSLLLATHPVVAQAQESLAAQAAPAQSPSQSPAWLDQLELKGSVTLFTGPGLGAHDAFTNLINQAQHSVLMEMYHLTDAGVADSIVGAVKRGLTTSIILDGKSLSNSESATIETQLESGGVTVIKSSPKFSITHSKAMVVDGVKAIVSSMNLTDHPEVRRDYGVVIVDPDVISEMESVFKADIANSAQGTANTPAVSDPHLLWSPINSGAKLHDLIGSAQHSIVAVAENILDTDVINDLIAAKARGVQVRVLSPACPLGQNPIGNYNSAKTLEAGGVEVRQMPNPATSSTPYLHGKMMVVDSRRAYVGSINYSFNSITKARELGIALIDQGVISGLDQAFDADFQSANPVSSAVPVCPGFPATPVGPAAPQPSGPIAAPPPVPQAPPTKGPKKPIVHRKKLPTLALSHF